jgi:hypothetical protein
VTDSDPVRRRGRAADAGIERPERGGNDSFTSAAAGAAPAASPAPWRPAIGGREEILMYLQVWRFITLVLAALSMGMAWAHALELGPKMALPAAEYILVQQIYQEFGRLGAVIEPAAILAAGVLAYLVRQRRPAFPLSLAGPDCWPSPSRCGSRS